MAIRRTSPKVAYSTNKPLQDLAPLAVAARRAPKATDVADVATIWVDISNHDVWIASGFQAGQAQWSRVDNDGGPGEFTSLTINPGPTVINGEFTLLGGDVHIGEGTFPGTYNFGTGNAVKTVTVGGVGAGSVTTIQSGYNSNLLLRAGGLGYIDYSKDLSGGTVSFVMSNNSNTANSDVKIQLGRGGTSGGNCEITYATSGGNNFVHGLLASDQSWNLEAATDLGAGTPLIKAEAGGDVTIGVGDIKVTGANKGISFADNGDVLDIYRDSESFTPVVTFGGGSTGVTYSTQAGRYTRIGNMVMFNIAIVLTSKGTDTGVFSITGLPFSVATTNSLAPTSHRLSYITTGATWLYSAVNGSAVLVYAASSGGLQTPISNTNVADNSQFYIQGTYFTS